MAEAFTPSAVLLDEHALIDRVLGALVLAVDRADAGVAVPRVVLEGAIDFIGAFIDGCHHAKEEILFDAVEEAVPRPVVDELRTDHVTARDLLTALRAAVAAADEGIGDAVRTLVAFLRGHLAREETTFFPALAGALDARGRRRLQARWQQLESEIACPAARAAFVELADTLAEGAAAVPRSRTAVAADVMRPSVPSVAPKDSLARAADMMARLDVRELPVVESGRVVGILTVRDMQPHRGHFEWTTVATAMTADPITVHPGTAASEVAALLLAKAINAVPVVAGGSLVGMLARSDLLRLLATI